MDKSYSALTEHYREVKRLAGVQAVLEWDQQTYMPDKANAYRAEQLTMLAGLTHQRKTDPRIGDWLAEAELEAANLAPEAMANVRELRRRYEKSKKLPESLVKRIAHCAASAHPVWIDARQRNDFASFKPYLEQMIELKREEADAIGYSECRYDALLDDYEPGALTREVSQALADLKCELIPLVQAIKESKVAQPGDVLKRHFPIEQQKSLAERAAAAIGFDFKRGRLDTTHHPFCTELGPHDVRITTRYDERFFSTAFFGVLHEAGHGLYEQGLREDQYGLPVGSYCSLGFHESQSRLWENIVGRSREFWTWLYPQAQASFPSIKDVSLDQFYRAVNQVTPSLIRVEADEATYNLHIIIRFELEQELMDRKLQVSDLPQAWNERYQNELGLTPDSDYNGVLQDIHWSAGLIGYFSTYSLGNLYSAQLFAAAERELGELHSGFASGQFEHLFDWLHRNVFIKGASYGSAELLKQATGSLLDHRPLIEYLRRKLSPLYELHV